MPTCVTLSRFYHTPARDLFHVEELGLRAKIFDLSKTSLQLIGHLRSKGVKIIEVLQQEFTLGVNASAFAVIHCCDEFITLLNK
jgi:hypothetical protein